MDNELFVVDNPKQDNSIVAMHESTMALLRISHGEYVLVKGKQEKSTALVCMSDSACEMHQARVNGGIQQNLGVTLGDRINVYKVNRIPQGTKVCILPMEDCVQGITGDLFEDWLKPYFFQAHRPITVDDAFVALGNNRAVEFKVIAIDVGGNVERHCIVGPDTEIFCDGAPLPRHFIYVRHMAVERSNEHDILKLPIPDRQVTIRIIAQAIFEHKTLYHLEGIRVEDVKIIFGGAILAHNKTLAECQINDNMTVVFTYPRPLAHPPSFLNFSSCQTVPEALQAIADAAAASSVGCNIFSLRDFRDQTPLHHACMRFEDDFVVSALITVGADVNAVDRDGFTPIFYAKSKEVALQLLRAGANPGHVAFCKHTPLHQAASSDIVDVLIAHGCDINPPQENFHLPFMSALHCARNADVARQLIRHKADVNARTPSGKTPLHCAIDVDTAAVLLAAKADVHACDARGQSVLHYAQSPALARLFLLRGVAMPSASDESVMPPIETAANFETALVFYEAGAVMSSPSTTRRGVGNWKWELSEGDDERYLEFQQFNRMLALAGLCRGAASAAALRRTADRERRFAPDARRSTFVARHLSMWISAASGNRLSSRRDGVEEGAATAEIHAGAEAVDMESDGCVLGSGVALPSRSLSKMQRLRCVGDAGVSGLLVSRLVGVSAHRLAKTVVSRVGSSRLALKLHLLEAKPEE